MDNGLLLMAETITDYIRENEWLSERDKMVLGTMRRDCVCKYSPVGEYKCYVELKFSQQSGAKSICVDTCLQDEIWRLNKKYGIRTIGCCCGHGVTTPYIQVAPDDDNIEQMHLLGYKPLPMDENGNGPWCFKPKTYLDYCGAKMNDSNASNALNALDNAQDGPIVTPCRGCSDYDGYGGCKSKGGCARAKMEVQE